ncbi:hypothetical protein K504DRAFT_49365 [Pleomassaria siparia CBS 279.74]|uniref:Uncharacterized protein n=1 Tax=Pleomassaria siparia CBS 279.74 TaxID=1314801 RepID=A0A6G1K2N0_9PLEO|nr:hypothetical protein K504DRAFT_49365 [Pleomassaria siparia CBS 279.74]
MDWLRRSKLSKLLIHGTPWVSLKRRALWVGRRRGFDAWDGIRGLCFLSFLTFVSIKLLSCNQVRKCISYVPDLSVQTWHVSRD